MGAYASYIVETFVTLLAVCVVAFVVLYGARRLGVGRPRGPVKLLGHLPLEARRSVYVVRVGKQVLVVGASEAGLVKLGEVAESDLDTAGDDVATGFGAGNAAFADVLAKVLGGRAAKKAEAAEEPRA